MYVPFICLFSVFSLQLFVSVSVKMAERALPPTSVNASRVTLASGVKPVCIGQTRFIVADIFLFSIYSYQPYDILHVLSE